MRCFKLLPINTLDLRPMSLALLAGGWSLAAQFVFNRIIFFYVANSEYTAVIIIALHLLGFLMGSLAVARRTMSPAHLIAASIIVVTAACVVLWHVGATHLGLWPTVVLTVLFSISSAGLAGAIVTSLIPADNAKGSGRKVIVFDTAGSVIGAAVAGFVVIPWLGIFAGFLLVVGLQIFSLLVSLPSLRSVLLVPAIACCLAIATAASAQYSAKEGLMITAGGMPIISTKGLGATPIESRQSPYGILTVFDFEFPGLGESRVLMADNRALCFVPEARAELEKTSEWQLGIQPMKALRGVKNLHIANIGLGCGVTMNAILEAAPKDAKLEVVEINPVMPAIQKQFDDLLPFSQQDPRVNVVLSDGFRYFAERDSTSTFYDAVILDVAWMQNMNATHLFSVEMFENVKSTLTQNGIFAVWSEEYNPYSPVSVTLYKTLKAVFPHVVTDSRYEAVLFFASDNPLPLTQTMEDTRIDLLWMNQLAASASVNRLDSLVMNRLKFSPLGDLRNEALSAQINAGKVAH